MRKFLSEKRFNRKIFILMICLFSFGYGLKGAVKVFEMQLGYATTSGNSMNKTIKNKAKLLVTYDKKIKLKRGDIVSALVYENDKPIIILKRIIALPNETIILDKSKVYVNGKLLDEPYVYYSIEINDNMEISLKEDEYFVMGDNRIKSTDSRNIGPIPREQIVGKILKYEN